MKDDAPVTYEGVGFGSASLSGEPVHGRLWAGYDVRQRGQPCSFVKTELNEDGGSGMRDITCRASAGGKAPSGSNWMIVQLKGRTRGM